MNNLDQLIKELSGKEVQKSTFIPESEELTEGLSDLMKSAQAWLKSVGKSISAKFQGAKIFLKKIGDKVFPFYKRGTETGVIDPKTNKTVVKVAGSGSRKTILINPKLIFESKETVFNQLLNEIRTKGDIEKITTKEIDDIGQSIQDVEEAPSDATDFVNSARVDFDDLYRILDEIAFGLKYRTSYKQDVPSLLLMGPPGAAKTSVIKQFAKNRGMKLKILEISSLYKEILGGFPIVQKVLKPGAVDLSDEEKSKLGDEFREIVVKIKSSDILPPSEDSNPWILFLDEFNRDSDKMGAAMNLVLTGNIGTSYYLPLKTIVVASGNLGQDIDGVNVADMDSATWDRFNRKALLTYDWISRTKFGEDDDDFGAQEDDEGSEGKEKIDKKYFEKVNKFSMGGDPAIIKNFMMRMSKDEGSDDWTVNLKQFNPDAPSTRLTPRTMSKISRSMKAAALKDWEEDDLIGSKDKKWYEKEAKSKDFPSAPSYYLHVNQLHPRYFRDIMRTSLGPDAGDVITDIFIKFQKTKQEATSMSVEDVILKWTSIRDEGKKKIPSQIKNEFAMRLPTFLDNVGTKAKFAKMVKDAGVDVSKFELEKGDEHIWAAINIHNFIKDSGLGLDLATGVAKQLADLRRPSQVKDDEKKDKPVKKDFIDDVLGYLIDASPIFSEAWATVAAAIESDFGGTTEFKRAQAFAKKGKLLTGPPPTYITKRLSGKDLYNYLLITNMQQQESKILDRVKLKKEKDKVEEAMRNLFRKMV